jgi:hypothetical protein
MRYSDKQRQAALDCLAANERDFQRTSVETGIAVRTLRKWVHDAEVNREKLAQLQDSLKVLQRHMNTVGSDDPREKLRDSVLVMLVDNAIPISESMLKDLEEATLSQKATALNQIIGSAVKLLQLLPPTREQVIRVEFIDADGTAHKTPYWARNHTEEPDAL